MRELSLTPEIEKLVHDNAVVAFGISGGKDSSTMVVEVTKWLDSVGHPRESRVCFHADLGLIDWPQTPEFVRMQAELSGVPLQIVRRNRGDMIEKWEQRWAANVKRFEQLECVNIITPWSSSQWRFCTGELKVDPIAGGLKKRFGGRKILNLVGIRRQESSGRRKAPVSKPMAKLKVKTKGTCGWQWNPILEYTVADVMEVHKEHSILLHPAYTEFGSDRLSCAFCVVARNADHLAALACKGNHESYMRLIDLEIKSAFSFKPNDWLCDRAPEFLGAFACMVIERAKNTAKIRRAHSDAVPENLRYVSGWPIGVPTMEEAELLAHTRQGVNELLGLNCSYLEPIQIVDRYQELMDLKENK